MAELFARAIEDVQIAYERSKLRAAQARYEFPSARVVFVRCTPSCIEYARLGDCTGVFALGSAMVAMAWDGNMAVCVTLSLQSTWPA